MASDKFKLGDLIEQVDERNYDGQYTLDDVRGISIQKIFIDTKANMTGVSLTPYKLVRPGCFAYVSVTSRNGKKLTLAHNTSDETYTVSSSYIVFRVNRPDLLLPDYLFMHFNRPEFDRYSRYNSWGSARETFSWEEMCDVEIELPPIEIQQKYVDIYNAMIANQKAYEAGLDDLKMACDSYIQKLEKELEKERIRDYIELKKNKVRESAEAFTIDDIRGISSVTKRFESTKANTDGLSIENYTIVENGDISFNPNTARMGDKIPIAMNNLGHSIIVSAIYPVFKVNKNKLLPEYLMLFFTRPEFDRYARFHSVGSARETFDWGDMQDVKVPIPSLEEQRAIANIYQVYLERRKINESLIEEIKTICPILIKGSLEEARKA